jgi:hypothetical protein
VEVGMKRLLLLLLVGCGGEEGGSLVGSWAFAGKECEGYQVQFSGATLSAMATSEDALDAVLTTSSCELVNAGIPISGDRLLVGSGQIRCSPNPCQLSYSVAIPALGESSQFAATCPDDFPVIADVRISVSGDEMRVTTSDTEFTCVETYARL